MHHLLVLKKHMGRGLLQRAAWWPCVPFMLPSLCISAKDLTDPIEGHGSSWLRVWRFTVV